MFSCFQDTFLTFTQFFTLKISVHDHNTRYGVRAFYGFYSRYPNLGTYYGFGTVLPPFRMEVCVLDGKISHPVYVLPMIRAHLIIFVFFQKNVFFFYFIDF